MLLHDNYKEGQVIFLGRTSKFFLPVVRLDKWKFSPISRPGHVLNVNFQSLEAASCYKIPQIKVTENCLDL